MAVSCSFGHWFFLHLCSSRSDCGFWGLLLLSATQTNYFFFLRKSYINFIKKFSTFKIASKMCSREIFNCNNLLDCLVVHNVDSKTLCRLFQQKVKKVRKSIVYFSPRVFLLVNIWRNFFYWITYPISFYCEPSSTHRTICCCLLLKNFGGLTLSNKLKLAYDETHTKLNI